MPGVLWSGSTTAHRKRRTEKRENLSRRCGADETKMTISISAVGSSSSHLQWMTQPYNNY